jgi:hypothetical protein
VGVAVLVVTMNVLKYGFSIDPAKQEVDKMEKKKKTETGKRTITVVRYLYVDSPTTWNDTDPFTILKDKTQMWRRSADFSA